jgi:5-formyltetrahydrofolate cyclo-ligase
MGVGYYDRLLADMPNAVTVGVAFDEQIVDAVPCEPHDRPLDAIVTPRGVRRRA